MSKAWKLPSSRPILIYFEVRSKSFAWTLTRPTNYLRQNIVFSYSEMSFFFLIISLFFFIFFFSLFFFVILCYFVIINFYKNYVVIIILFNYTFFLWKLLLFLHVPGCSGMFMDVPECSGMFHVPGFIDAPFIPLFCSRSDFHDDLARKLLPQAGYPCFKELI